MASGSRRPGRPKGPQQDPNVRRDRLLESTEEAIRLHGPDVSMDQVAQVAGVSRSTLYDNFETRSVLASAVIDRFGAPMLSDLTVAMAAPLSLEAIVRTGIRIVLDHVELAPDIYRFVLRNTADDALYVAVSAVLGAMVQAALPRDLFPHEVAEELGSAALGAIVSATERWSERNAPRRVEFERTLADFVWAGLVAGGVSTSDEPVDLRSAFADLR